MFNSEIKTFDHASAIHEARAMDGCDVCFQCYPASCCHMNVNTLSHQAPKQKLDMRNWETQL